MLRRTWTGAMLLAGAGAMSGLTRAGEMKRQKPKVIAHRGASGYLPEHTEGAKVLAIAQGADLVEQDVVLTKDLVPIVCHDVTLDETTDVASRFPELSRADGRWYAADLLWEQVQQLQVVERRHHDTGKPFFSKRFPGGFGQRLMRLVDEIALVRGVNQTRSLNVGWHVECKQPAWHEKHLGVRIEQVVYDLLQQLEVGRASEICYLQCFESNPLQRLRAAGKNAYPLVFLIGGKPDGLPPRTDLSLEARIELWTAWIMKHAAFADGIGPSLDLLVERGEQGEMASSGMFEAALATKKFLHPYTVRADSLPKWSESLEDLHGWLIERLPVDGFFTDFPDLSRRAIDAYHDS
ncbi:MAG: glycerophosphodiester phosphodiesterase family protein [Pirellulaceae bacterium]